jgi:hypothetical protein
MNKKLKWSLVAGAVLIVIGVIGGKHKPDPSNVDSTTGGAPAGTSRGANPKPEINQLGLAFAQALLSDDIADALNGGKSNIGLPSLGIDYSVSSLQLAREYSDNEVAADAKYKRKLLLISGRIKSINKDFSDSAYLSLPGIDDFSQVQAHLDDEGATDAASYKRNASVMLVCTGAGMIIQSPMLRDCTPANRYAARIDKEWRKKLATWFADGGKWPGDDKSGTALAAMYVARTAMPDASACDQNVGGAACRADLQRAMKTGGPAMLAEYSRIRLWLDLPESLPLTGSASSKKSAG